MALTELPASKPPAFLEFRSHTLFIVATVGVGMFTDLFLYGLVVPILPFILKDRIHLPQSQIQSHVSGLLAAYAVASVILSPIAGYLADKTSSRQLPFLAGLSSLIFATILLFTGESVLILTIARLAQGASSAFVWTIGLALCIDTVGPKNLGKTIGSIFSFISVGELFSPAVGGALYRKAGLGAVAGVSVGLLVIDLVMRLLLIEKKVAARYTTSGQEESRQSAVPERETVSNTNRDQPGTSTDNDPSETSPLLSKTVSTSSSASKETTDPYYVLLHNRPWIFRKVPILDCFSRSPSLILAQLIVAVQAFLFAAFDATIPTHAAALYGYDSLHSGLLFLPLGLLNIIVGPIAGWAVDRYGTKLPAVAGYAYLVPILALLRVPGAEPKSQQIALYCVLLGLCGVGLATIGSISIVECGSEIDKFYKRNPHGVFSEENGPYAQLYGINSMVFSAGLSLGPVVAGKLREAIGYGDMNAVLAGVSAFTSISCWIWLGRKPRPARVGHSRNA